MIVLQSRLYSGWKALLISLGNAVPDHVFYNVHPSVNVVTQISTVFSKGQGPAQIQFGVTTNTGSETVTPEMVLADFPGAIRLDPDLFPVFA